MGNMVLIRVSQGTMQRQPCEVCGCEPADEHHAREYAKGEF